MRRARTIAALTLASLAAACGAPSDDATADRPMLEVAAIDAAALDVFDGHGVHDVVWSMGEDRRGAVFQHPPSRAELRAPVGGEGCRLRFATGLQPEAWGRSDGAGFRLLAPGADGAEQVLFETVFDPAAHTSPVWVEHEVALPEAATKLVFQTTIGPGGSPNNDWVGWATPHVVCPLLVGSDATPPERPHVVLVSLDTLRPDRLGVYGYDGDTSPRLDAFAREALVFDNAFAVAPFTLPTHASMFTGLYPHEHGAGHTSPFVPLASAAEGGAATLAERLRDAGYRTTASTAGGIMSRKNGLARGFDRWSENTRENLGAALPRILGALAGDPSRPTFLFVHTYDIHGPYPDAPPHEPAKRTPKEARDAAREWRRINAIGMHDYLELDRYAGVDDVRRAYDEGIRRTDANLAALFTRLRQLGMWDHALVVVTSDHGETLYDRGLYIGHTYTLHDEIVRIPLIVKLPAAGTAYADAPHATGRTDELVDHTDLFPTILAAVGVEAPDGVSGSDVFARLRGDLPRRGRVRGEAAHTGSRYVRTPTWKAIAPAYALDDPRARVPGAFRDRFDTAAQLYDVAADPGERTNLAAAGAGDAASTNRLADAEATPRPGSLPKASDQPVDADLEQQLRALGYVE